jgi:hypothetical protein
MQYTTETLVSDRRDRDLLLRDIENLPYREVFALPGSVVVNSPDVIKDYASVLELIRKKAIEPFVREIDLLIAATNSGESRAGESQVVSEPERADRYLNVYELDSPRLLRFFDNDYQNIKNFLFDEIRYYTPSRDAIARTQNLVAKLESFEKELEALKILKKRDQAPSGNLAPSAELDKQIPSDAEEIAKQLNKLFRSIRSDILNWYLRSWQLDEMMKGFEENWNNIQAKHSVLLSSRRVILRDSFQILIGYIVVAILLLVVRDFLKAMIDVAVSTENIRKQLDSSSIEFD